MPIDELITEYHVDNVVRLGSDNHYPEDGGPPQVQRPSHETSYCIDGTLYRSEMTFLEDNTIAQEMITMNIDEETGKLMFELIVNGNLSLKASCTAVTE